ncbi:MAG: cell division protein ZapE, partial [Pseudomonadales bacterium]|nr:cell division protein ZapE [Pseudomonadales bacterium]
MSNFPPEHSPSQLYLQATNQGRIEFDAAQQQAVEALNQLFKQLDASRYSTPCGLYLWGQVGRGKTFLMDLFCSALPSQAVWRIHFHRFMAWVHQRLTHYAGRKNPLKLVARDIARKYRVLCFDELFVSDIGDAMLL